MRASLGLLLLFFGITVASSTAPRAQEPPLPERWYPLDLGDEWVYGWYDCDFFGIYHICNPLRYLKQRVVGDTVLAGEPHALVAFEQFDSTGVVLQEVLAAMRVAVDTTSSPWQAEVEVYVLRGSLYALDGMYGSWCGERPLPTGEGTSEVVVIGGISYTLTMAGVDVDCGSLGSWDRDERASFALDLGVVWKSGYHHLYFSGSTQSQNSRLVYANVGGVVYGEGNPVVSEPPAEAPSAFALESVYPNPFRGSVAVAFAVPAPEAVTVAVFDALGRRVLVRDLGRLGAGPHTVTLDGADLAPGVYVVRVTAGEEAVTRRVVRVE